MNTYAATAATHEELYSLARGGDMKALERLCTDYRPLFISESMGYRGRMETMDTEDFIQEGFITVWKIVEKGNYQPASGSFGGYLKQAVRFRFNRIWTDFCMKNMVLVGETEDFQGVGYTTRAYGIADCAERCRKQTRERARRWRARKAAETDRQRAEQGLEPIYRPSLATEEEKAAHAEEVRQRKLARERAHQRKLRETDKAGYNEYRRIQGGISRSRKAVENWTAKGNGERAERARMKLAEYEAEMRAFKGA